MPVRIHKVFDENAFESGTADFSIGNAGQWKKRTIRVYAGISTESSQSNTLTIRPQDIYGRAQIERVNGSWIDEGYKIGDDISFARNQTLNDEVIQNFPPVTRTIVDLTDNVLYINDFYPITSRSYPGQYQYHDEDSDVDITVTLNWLLIYKIIRPDELTFRFNQIPNDDIDGVSMNSIIDGTQNVLYVDGLDPTDTTTFHDMIQTGNKSGMTILNPKARGYSVGTGVNAWKNYYEVSFFYKISGEFEDVSNYTESNNPPDFYLNNNCLSNNYQFEIRSASSDPNYTMINDLNSKATKKLGNTGWKNENYNGLPVASSILDIEYRVGDSIGDIIQEPLYNNDTFVTITIDDPDVLPNSSKYGFQFMYLPLNEEQYKTNEYSESQNLLINSVQEHELTPLVVTASPVIGTWQGFTNSVGARMDVKDTHVSVNGTTVTMTLTLSPNTEFGQYMLSQEEGNRLVTLNVSVGKPNTTQQNSNRARLIADSVQMERYLPSRGEFPALQTLFLQHNQTEIDYALANTDEANGFIMDDMKHYALLPISKSANYIIKAINTQIVIENSTTGESGVLEDNRIDLSGYPITDGYIVEANNDEGLRGFNLHEDNKNNWFRCNRRSSYDSLNFWYLDYWYAFRMRFEDWISSDDLPDSLYIETDALTNFNENWLNKQISGWQLKYKFYIEVEETFTNTVTGEEYTETSRFENSYNVNIQDYESGTPIGTITALDSNGSNTFIDTDAEIYNKNVNGIDCDGLNTFKARFTGIDSANFLYAYVDLYAWKQGSIFGSYQLSTAVTNLLAGNPLEPITGTTPTITIVNASTIDVEFNINPDNLPQSADLYYTIGARIESLEVPPLRTGKLTEDGIQKQLENNDYKIVE